MKRLLATLTRKPVNRTPVWMMRQAGRYLAEYRKLRDSTGGFIAMCKNPQLAAEISLQPIKRFPQLDGVIIFSDILTIPDAMGLGLQFIEGEGPRFRRPLRNAEDINILAVPEVEFDLAYVFNAIKLVREKMPSDKTLIGFCGSPWTIAYYMFDGAKHDRLEKVKNFVNQDRVAFHKLLNLLSVACADYLYAQIQAGAEVVQIFDTWGAELGADYHEYSLQYVLNIVQRLGENLRGQHPPPPIILYTRADKIHFDAIADSEIAGVSVPSDASLGQLRGKFGDRLILQGNLDQSLLTLDDPTAVEHATREVLADYGEGGGHVFNLGHGITPNARIENVECMLSVIEDSAEPATG